MDFIEFKEFKETYQKQPVKPYANTVPSNPMVSVCVQTYQHANYIVECLDGILKQETDFPFEILLGEDASSDGTRQICIDYAKKYPDKIRLFLHHRKNNISMRGVPTGRFNFIYNLFSAKGRYIALCEGDDYWTDPLKLQKQVDFMELNSDCSLCYHSVRHVFMTENKMDKTVGPKTAVNLKFTSEEFIKSKYARTVTLFFRSSVIQNYPKWPFQSPIGDYPLQMVCASLGNIGYIGGEPMAVYRVGVSGSTNDGRFGTKKEQKKWMGKRLYNHKKSRDLFNRHSDYKYNLIIQQQKQKFSFGMLYQGLDNFNRLEMLKLYKEYIPYPLKINRKTFRFWSRFMLGSRLYDSLKKRI